MTAASLLSAAAVRERARNIAAAVSAGDSRSFRIDRSRLPAAAERVADVTRIRYPNLRIPYHSRWRHFEAGGVDRADELTRALDGRNAADCARARIDLTVVSVLLDAGAGPAWSYREAATGQRHARSEGLGVATFRAFMGGAFSAHRDDPHRVDAAALAGMDSTTIAAMFQADGGNPLVGVGGRAALLCRLGAALAADRRVFGGLARPGGLYDTIAAADPQSVSAATLLHTVLVGLNPIWPAGNALDGIPLGDAWRHPHAGGAGSTAGWVPFHKLSQWLTYSLFEPFEWAGIGVIDRDGLTGLPEYRNGGLLIDTGVLALLDPSVASTPVDVGSELVVEWRALTVALLDELAPLVRACLGIPALPLACILEGGTWGAGRELAQHLRGGAPPLGIHSDGTVF